MSMLGIARSIVSILDSILAPIMLMRLAQIFQRTINAFYDLKTLIVGIFLIVSL